MRASHLTMSSKVLRREMSYTSIAPTAPPKNASVMDLNGNLPPVSQIWPDTTKKPG